MSLLFRRSFQRGPIRLNFSQHGVGASIGIPGFRVGVTPRGRHYLQAGRGGLYVRSNLDSNPGSPSAPPDSTMPNPSSSTWEASETAPASGFQASQRKDLIAQLTEADSRIPWILIAMFGVILGGIVLCVWNVYVGSAVIGIGVVGSPWAYRREHQQRLVTLEYHLSPAQQAAFAQVVDACNQLAGCTAVWAVDSKLTLTTDLDRKRNAGAGTLVQRHPIQVGEKAPPFLASNVPIPCLHCGSLQIFFFPDFILLKDLTGYGTVTYQDLQVTHGELRFTEEVAPADATVVDTTWRFPNKKGGPDQRYANNAQLPVCLYGSVIITIQDRHMISLETSRVAAADGFSQVMRRSISTYAHLNQPTPPQRTVPNQARPVRTRALPSSETFLPSVAITSTSEAEQLRSIEAEEQARLNAFNSAVHARSQRKP